jgi:hypothetical protein
MANATIPSLPQVIALTGAEQMEAVQAGTSVRVTVAQIVALANGGSPAALTPIPTASLPTAAGNAGLQFLVTDSSVNTFYTVVAAGGAFSVPVYSDGNEWRVG